MLLAKKCKGGEGEAMSEGGVGDPLLHQERFANTQLSEKIQQLWGEKQPLCWNILDVETSSEDKGELWHIYNFENRRVVLFLFS